MNLSLRRDRKDVRDSSGCFRILRSGFLMFFLNLTIGVAVAQEVQVKGKILEADGSALPGASVTIKGQNKGTISDASGNFSILAARGNTLVLSMVGYESLEYEVKGAVNNLELTLNSSENLLSEIVVVGYGTQRKRDLTGAVSSLTPDALKEVPTANLIASLKGRLAGVDIQSNSTTPGASGQIRIRGNRQMARTQGESDAVDAPLLVVDGMQFNGSINDLNPDNIASIDVLKDASATAIYGSRGAGGVILITTKRGATGKPVLSYNGRYGVLNAFDHYKVFNGAEYAAFKQEAAAGNIVNPGTTSYGLSPMEQAGLAKGISTDWQDLILKSGYVTNHDLNLSGGTDKTRYGFGGGFYQETGIVPGQDYTRYTLQTSVDHKISNKVKIGISTMNILGNSNNEGNPIGGLLRMTPLVAPYNEDGTVNRLPLTGTLDNATVSLLSIVNNHDAISNKTKRLRTYNTLYGEYEIIPGLKYRLAAGADYRQENSGSYYGPNTFYNNSTDMAQARSTIGTGEASTLNLQNQLDYNVTLAKLHRLSLTGLFEVQKETNQTSGFNGTGLPADYLQYYNLNLASTITANNGGYFEKGLISYMGRMNYTFNDRYSLTATFRRDGSSVLSPGYQYFNYPALAAAWNITEESFMSGLNFISNLKLRAGWGISANGGVNPYTTLGTLGTNFYNFGTTTGGQNIGYFVNSLANKQLTWASTSQSNFGLDFGLFNNRFTGSVEVYQQKTKDILLAQNLPASNGATTTTVNAGKTKGHGIEITLGSVNMNTKGGFKWTTDLNFALNREEIVELQNPALLSNIADGWFVGEPLSVIYDVKKIGIWQTSEKDQAAVYGRVPGQIKTEDINNDNKIDANDRQIVGNFQPKWMGGLTNRFSYKGFDLAIVIHARMGQTVVAPYLMSDAGAQGYPFFNNGRVNSLKRDYWTPTNPTNEFPRPDASSDATLFSSTLGYVDGSFVKVRSLEAGYLIAPKLLGKSGISSLRLFVNVVNPFILYSPFVAKGYGMDPEGNGYGGVSTSQVGGTPVPGRAITVNLNNPPTRQFNFGLNVKF